MLSTREGVTTDTNAKRLAQANVGRLRDGLVRQGTRTRDDADFAWLVDVPGLDTHLATKGVDNARAIGADETRLGLAVQRVHHLRWSISARRRVVCRRLDAP